MIQYLGAVHSPSALDRAYPRQASGDRIRSGGGLVVLFVGGDGFQIFGFKNLIAIETAHVIHAVSPRQNLGTTVLAGLHKSGRLHPF
jgi:hypothetical protein